ncbi:1365_t:CDS:1 [Ambispora gerdemannii]|uniref:1365_t:CDS:1 n=1 Tax=Ambispora gerdemannii TaxID=144530 RepID=A0A9N9CU12_9GLOM|nr:1365_t:CDS:1 [Ambispora gerdemannii]
MPFGTKNAPAFFQRTMEFILNDVIFEDWIHIYIDDITIGANNEQETIERMNKVLQLIKKENLKAKLSKCHFMKTKIEILGWTITNKQAKITPGRIEAISKWEFPDTKQKISKIPTFLGIVNYLSIHIPNAAQLTEHLRKYQKNPENDALKTKALQAFNKIKEIITSEPITVHIDWTQPLEIYTDACDSGVGAIL